MRADRAALPPGEDRKGSETMRMRVGSTCTSNISCLHPAGNRGSFSGNSDVRIPVTQTKMSRVECISIYLSKLASDNSQAIVVTHPVCWESSSLGNCNRALQPIGWPFAAPRHGRSVDSQP